MNQLLGQVFFHTQSRMLGYAVGTLVGFDYDTLYYHTEPLPYTSYMQTLLGCETRNHHHPICEYLCCVVLAKISHPSGK